METKKWEMERTISLSLAASNETTVEAQSKLSLVLTGQQRRGEMLMRRCAKERLATMAAEKNAKGKDLQAMNHGRLSAPRYRYMAKVCVTEGVECMAGLR